MRIFRSKLAALGVIALVAGWIMVTATAASAHHPIVSGSVGCSPNGVHIVNWTIQNSETTSGSNRSMTVTAISVNHGSVDGVAAGAVLPPRSLAGSTRQATTTLPGTQLGTVTLTVTARWPSAGPQNVVRTATVTLNSPCTQPTTTTTKPPTTTTSTTAPTTTTTSTTIPTTTTSTTPATTTTTTQSTTTTTAVGATTTTTAPDETTTTTVGVFVLGEEFTRGGELARTGGGRGWMVGVALAAVIGALGAARMRRGLSDS